MLLRKRFVLEQNLANQSTITKLSASVETEAFAGIHYSTFIHK